MKKLVVIIAVFFSLQRAQAQGECQQFIVPEESKVTITLNNTAHDKMGSMDEIRAEVSSSDQKLIEDDMFSDFFGSVLYKQDGQRPHGTQRTDVAFNSSAVVFSKDIKFEQLYNKFLNILLTEEDAEVPLASGSIEVPFYALSGGNHDDLLFNVSKKLKMNDRRGTHFSLTNELGDQITVTITPTKQSILSRKKLQEKFNEERNRLNEIRKRQAGQEGTHEGAILNKEFNETLARAILLQDILLLKMGGSCAE